jgi:NAD(P)-dependent dehydrogenase (short-subunit alcohol dehydrogenase family)
MNLFDPSNRVAVVSGANRGIGLAMASVLAKAGAHVAIWARHGDKNAAAQQT